MKKQLLFIILLLGTVYSASYYADLQIKVDNQGFTTITGNTNYPNLTTIDNPSYTSKKNKYWTFKLEKPQTFSEYIYMIQLPETASINYLKSSGTINIQNQNKFLIIKGYGENKTLSITIQYQTSKQKKHEKYEAVITAIIILIILLTIYFYFKKKKRKKDKPKNKKIKTELLPERQKQIIQLLQEKNKPLTQAQIRKELRMPKASTTRNINSLELKGLITKEKAGITNLIKLKKE